jgi:hypothetical protein
MSSKAADFRSNVSATPSVMKSKWGEVALTDAGWILTEKGRDSAENVMTGTDEIAKQQELTTQE